MEVKSFDDRDMKNRQIDINMIDWQYTNLALTGDWKTAQTIRKSTNINPPYDVLIIAAENYQYDFIDNMRPSDVQYEQGRRNYNIKNGDLLCYALEKNATQLWKYALQNKWIITPRGWVKMPVYYAAVIGNLEFVQIYMKMYGLALDNHNNSGAMTVHKIRICARAARENGHKDIERELLSYLTIGQKVVYYCRL